MKKINIILYSSSFLIGIVRVLFMFVWIRFFFKSPSDWSVFSKVDDFFADDVFTSCFSINQNIINKKNDFCFTDPSIAFNWLQSHTTNRL